MTAEEQKAFYDFVTENLPNILAKGASVDEAIADLLIKWRHLTEPGFPLDEPTVPAGKAPKKKD